MGARTAYDGIVVLSNVGDTYKAGVPLLCGSLYWYVDTTAKGKVLDIVSSDASSHPIVSLISVESQWTSPVIPIHRKVSSGIRVKTIGAGKVFFIEATNEREGNF